MERPQALQFKQITTIYMYYNAMILMRKLNILQIHWDIVILINAMHTKEIIIYYHGLMLYLKFWINVIVI